MDIRKENLSFFQMIELFGAFTSVGYPIMLMFMKKVAAMRNFFCFTPLFLRQYVI